jgi:hypothetical protein
MSPPRSNNVLQLTQEIVQTERDEQLIIVVEIFGIPPIRLTLG